MNPSAILDPFGFELSPDPAGGWAVRDQAGRSGGLFATREAALAFIRQERRVLAACAAERARFEAGAGSMRRARAA